MITNEALGERSRPIAGKSDINANPSIDHHPARKRPRVQRPHVINFVIALCWEDDYKI